MDGDGLDELTFFSNTGKSKRLFTIVEFTSQGVQANVREIYNLEKTPAAYSKIYAEKAANVSPKFYEESYTMTGKGWVYRRELREFLTWLERF